jgi:hypothetical protein
VSDHDRWEELAAGWALDALEPEDEHAFTEHVRHCERCRRDLAGFSDVAGHLAYAADAAEPPPELGARILAAAAAERPATFRDQPPADLVVPRDRPTRQRSTFRVTSLAAAAAGVVLLALGAWNVQLRAGNVAQRDALDRRTAALGCLAEPGAPTFRMAGAGGRRGTVCLTGSEAYVVADRLAPNPANQVYVLWWMDANDTPHAVERFDVASRRTAVLALPLPVRPEDVKRMTVSLEPGRTLPDAPTHPIASS